MLKHMRFILKLTAASVRWKNIHSPTVLHQVASLNRRDCVETLSPSPCDSAHERPTRGSSSAVVVVCCFDCSASPPCVITHNYLCSGSVHVNTGRHAPIFPNRMLQHAKVSYCFLPAWMSVFFYCHAEASAASLCGKWPNWGSSSAQLSADRQPTDRKEETTTTTLQLDKNFYLQFLFKTRNIFSSWALWTCAGKKGGTRD